MTFIINYFGYILVAISLLLMCYVWFFDASTCFLTALPPLYFWRYRSLILCIKKTVKRPYKSSFMKKSDKVPFALVFLACAGALISSNPSGNTPYHDFFDQVKWACIVLMIIGSLILLKQGLSEKQE